MNSNTTYLLSNVVGMLASLIVILALLQRLWQARHQQIPSTPVVPGCVIRICRTLLLFIFLLGLALSLDWINDFFHLFWHAGSIRNFIITLAILILMLVWRDLGILLGVMHFERK